MTFTILVAGYGLLGAATASRSLAVGSGVPAIAPGIGAVASQAHTNRALRRRLLDALAAGATPESAIAAMAGFDPKLSLRQIAALDPAGVGAAYTGDECTPWAGHRMGNGYVLLGNFLAGEQVLDAMETVVADPTARRSTPGELAALLIAALGAGDSAGGDSRGRQSAAVLIADQHAAHGYPVDFGVDLRVDDSADPIAELARLHSLALESVRARRE